MNSINEISKIIKIKLVFLGEASVGKTSLVQRMLMDRFREFQDSTIGASFFTKKIEIDGEKLHYEIWDTAGQERYRSLAPMYYRNGDCAVLVFDVNCRESYEKAKEYVKEMEVNNPGCLMTILLGNKCDMLKEKICEFEIREYCDTINAVYFQCSAKTNKNIHFIQRYIDNKLPNLVKKRNLIQNPPLIIDNKSQKRTSRCC